MQFNNSKHYSPVSAFVASLLMMALVLAGYFLFEPSSVHGALGDSVRTFEVTATISGEISIDPAPANVNLLDPIPGLSGGSATGTTPFTVTTNNPAGYTVTIAFASTTAMNYNGTSSASIPNLGGVVATTSMGVTTGGAAFGYTITGDHVVSALLGDNGSSCGSGTASALHCWQLQADASTPYTIVDSGVATDESGDEYNLYFKVVVGANPSPSLPLGTYTATATITALEK